MTPDTWHGTHDTWHMTCDKWWGVNILSKFQLHTTYGLGVCRPAPATVGLVMTTSKTTITNKTNKDNHRGVLVILSISFKRLSGLRYAVCFLFLWKLCALDSIKFIKKVTRIKIPLMKNQIKLTRDFFVQAYLHFEFLKLSISFFVAICRPAIWLLNCVQVAIVQQPSVHCVLPGQPDTPELCKSRLLHPALQLDHSVDHLTHPSCACQDKSGIGIWNTRV